MTLYEKIQCECECEKSKMMLRGIRKEPTGEILEEISPAYSDEDMKLINQDEIDKLIAERQIKPCEPEEKKHTNIDQERMSDTDFLLLKFRNHVKIIAANNKSLRKMLDIKKGGNHV